jgi:ribosomal protein L18E
LTDQTTRNKSPYLDNPAEETSRILRKKFSQKNRNTSKQINQNHLRRLLKRRRSAQVNIVQVERQSALQELFAEPSGMKDAGIGKSLILASHAHNIMKVVVQLLLLQ